nr:putative disease resistance protein rga4 [Quercus suber]
MLFPVIRYSRKRNMVRKKDRFWEHAEDLNNGRFKCNFCKRDFAGGASRIKCHLAGVKGHDIDICTKVSKEVQGEATLIDVTLSRVFEKSNKEYGTEIVLSVAVEGLLAKVRSLVIDHIGSGLGCKEQLIELLVSLSKIQVVLQDTEKWQITGELMRIRLEQLRDVVYDADDVLDEFDFEIFKQEVQSQNQIMESVGVSLLIIENKMKTIINRLLDTIKNGLRVGSTDTIPEISQDRGVDSYLNDLEIVGRGSDVSEIVNMLTNASNQCISILPIVGMAGLGKTTLAKEVYNNELIRKHFDVLAWVCVTKNFNFKRILELPEELSNLINLRHIYIDTALHRMPKNMGLLTCLQTLPIFVVGQDEGHSIKELGALKNLRGEIGIYNLGFVKDEEEAKSAKLKEKEIFKLGLYWDKEEDYRDKDEKVLEGLQPHPNLKSLTIQWYGGKKFPSWVGLSPHHNLIEIKLGLFKNCEEVPTLGHLPCLRVLEIFGMEKVRCIGSEFYSDESCKNTILFPALRILKLEEMRVLEEWKDAKELTIAGEVLVFPCLEKLTLFDCPKLRYLPDSLNTCDSLQKLVVGCGDLRYLPGVPSSIIRSGIEDLPTGSEYLENWDCLPSSSTYSIQPSLQSIKLFGSDTLLDQIQYFIALKILWIEVNSVVDLPEWLGNISSLQQLYLVYCFNLVHLPTKEAMQRLTQLKKLVISDCPKFEHNERIKISHVPCVEINNSPWFPYCKDFED